MPAQRTYGIDQDFYPWSPIVARPVLRGSDNARVALAVIVNQPGRIRHLDEVLGHICAHQGVWRATGRQITDWFKVQPA